ncbi:hypothetical protein TIFTF001_039201 [Ficus carica]|uniref:Uncharacterized protein n=1 Tax=Ficus carica TaxID=3494 RepID=A0AA88E8Q0_FICCA|nr:hypothetical protein TIFTF001_039201 [Ficus carica]
MFERLKDMSERYKNNRAENDKPSLEGSKSIIVHAYDKLQFASADGSERKAKNEVDIVDEVLGKRSRYLKGWGQLPEKNTNESSQKASVPSSSTYVHETLHKEQNIIDKQQNTIDELSEKIARLEKITQQAPNNMDQPDHHRLIRVM